MKYFGLWALAVPLAILSPALLPFGDEPNQQVFLEACYGTQGSLDWELIGDGETPIFPIQLPPIAS